ncbi:hypothetical protein Pfo_005233 [Paulownia fortunei]|nr:hypothetical protein Pfo_005233 [Paulownia fortunei]
MDIVRLTLQTFGMCPRACSGCHGLGVWGMIIVIIRAHRLGAQKRDRTQGAPLATTSSSSSLCKNINPNKDEHYLNLKFSAVKVNELFLMGWRMGVGLMGFKVNLNPGMMPIIEDFRSAENHWKILRTAMIRTHKRLK